MYDVNEEGENPLDAISFNFEIITSVFEMLSSLVSIFGTFGLTNLCFML
jgi:hypothetical protein